MWLKYINTLPPQTYVNEITIKLKGLELLFWQRRGKRFSPLLPHPLIVLPAGRLLGLSGFWFWVGFPSLTQSFFARWQALRPFRFLVSTGFPLSHPILPIGRPQVFQLIIYYWGQKNTLNLRTPRNASLVRFWICMCSKDDMHTQLGTWWDSWKQH